MILQKLLSLPLLATFLLAGLVSASGLSGPTLAQTSHAIPSPTADFLPYQTESTIFGEVRIAVTGQDEITLAIDQEDATSARGVKVDYILTFTTSEPLTGEVAFRGPARVDFLRGGLVVTASRTDVRFAFAPDNPPFRDTLHRWLEAHDDGLETRLFDRGRQLLGTDAPSGMALDQLEAVALENRAVPRQPDRVFNPDYDPDDGTLGGGCASSCSKTCQGGGSCSVDCTSQECAECECSDTNRVSCRCT